jgi:hypothetical protein
MAAPHGKGLTRWPPRYQINRIFDCAKLELSNVALMQRPMAYGVKGAILVLSECVTGPTVPVDDSGRPKACLAGADP